jgi:hypothetical protein
MVSRGTGEAGWLATVVMMTVLELSSCRSRGYWCGYKVEEGPDRKREDGNTRQSGHYWLGERVA